MVSPRPTSATPTDSASPAQVLRRFRAVFNAVKTHFQQVERVAGVGGAQVWALSVVQSAPGLGVSQLARAMDVHQTTASNLVRTLTQQGLLEVRKEGADRRSVQLYLKPDGEQVLARTPGPFAGVLPEALAALDPATLQRLDQDLGTLLALLKPEQGAGNIPLAEL